MPSSKNYVRDLKQEYKTSVERGDGKRRAERNKARRELEREGVVHKGDGLDVDHKHPLSKGGSESRGNLRAVSASKNRSFARNSDGSLKSQVSKKERK